MLRQRNEAMVVAVFGVLLITAQLGYGEDIQDQYTELGSSSEGQRGGFNLEDLSNQSDEEALANLEEFCAQEIGERKAFVEYEKELEEIGKAGGGFAAYERAEQQLAEKRKRQIRADILGRVGSSKKGPFSQAGGNRGYQDPGAKFLRERNREQFRKREEEYRREVTTDLLAEGVITESQIQDDFDRGVKEINRSSQEEEKDKTVPARQKYLDVEEPPPPPSTTTTNPESYGRQ